MKLISIIKKLLLSKIEAESACVIAEPTATKEECQQLRMYIEQQGGQTARPKVYAVDFDGTLCVSRFPEIIAPKKEVIDKIKRIKAAGHKIILWTCRTEEHLEVAVQWCREQGLEFDAVNDELPEQKERFNKQTRKVWADYYIDDKAIRPDEINV